MVPTSLFNLVQEGRSFSIVADNAMRPQYSVTERALVYQAIPALQLNQPRSGIRSQRNCSKNRWETSQEKHHTLKKTPIVPLKAEATSPTRAYDCTLSSSSTMLVKPSRRRSIEAVDTSSAPIQPSRRQSMELSSEEPPRRGSDPSCSSSAEDYEKPTFWTPPAKPCRRRSLELSFAPSSAPTMPSRRLSIELISQATGGLPLSSTTDPCQ